MALTDPIADLLTRVRNGQKAKLAKISCPSSNMKKAVLDVLKEEGYIRGYNEEQVRAGIKNLQIELKYHEGEAAIREIKRVSKPGQRVYSKITDLKPYRNGLGTIILSTPQGVLSDAKARQLNVGGEVICNIF